MAAPAARIGAKQLARQSVRGFATEKQILLRIGATQNLQKITSSMKMVSAAKLKGDTTRVAASRPFNEWTQKMGSTSHPIEDLDVSSWPEKNLMIAFTSDRGLCGGVNSFISRGIRGIAEKLRAQGKDFKLVVNGEKGRAQMRRAQADHIVSANTDVSYPMNFATTTALANEALKVDPADYDAVHIVFNEYVSAISYIPSVKTLPVFQGEGFNEPLVEYEFEPGTKSEVLADLREFLLASEMHVAALENSTSEQSSRTQAMENASKNAGELIESLTLQYNKARQARITTELVEIISGASALE